MPAGDRDTVAQLQARVRELEQHFDVALHRTNNNSINVRAPEEVSKSPNMVLIHSVGGVGTTSLFKNLQQVLAKRTGLAVNMAADTDSLKHK